MIFPDHVSIGKLKNRLKAVGLACGIREQLTCMSPVMQLRDNDFGGRYSDGKQCRNDGAFIYFQHTNLCPNHRSEDFKGYGSVDETEKI
ncbi:hypothetical protein HR15_10080 [Porphyromonas gulae]|uniref:Uncharacterized protein n=1 Tax=Porphyromonas gulae TaxID=111105 RepID=A0A0A2F563_9PORP|nr:hypothetical protein HR15_10080 [Porphyromonas gulae]